MAFGLKTHRTSGVKEVLIGKTNQPTYSLTRVEGIGSKQAKKLREAGVDDTQSLLEKGRTRQGRKYLARESGISEKMILTWVNHADLFRIKGVGEEYADLLEQSGVDSVMELKNRNPESLREKIVEVNNQRHLVRNLPSEQTLHSWISQAENLPRMVEH